MGQVEVVVQIMGEGWLMVHAVLPTEFQRQVEFERQPNLIHRTLVDWLQKNPSVKVRSTLGIVEDGFTIAVHVWFDSM
jgi:hypothetical protein